MKCLKCRMDYEFFGIKPLWSYIYVYVGVKLTRTIGPLCEVCLEKSVAVRVPSTVEGS